MKNKKVKLLILSRDYSPNTGWGTVSYYCRKHLGKHYEIVSLSSIEEKFIYAPYNPLAFLFAFFDTLKIRKKVKDCNYVLCLCEPLILHSVWLKFFRKKRKIVALGYGTYIYVPFKKTNFSIINRFFLNYLDKLCVSSNYSKKKVGEFYKKKLSVLPLGVESEKYKRDKNVEKEKVFLFVGEQKERKGVRYLIDAFEKLHKEFPEYKLHFVGPKNQIYVDEVKRKNLDSVIFFKGKVSDKELIKQFSLAFCHVLPSVNTSDFEGFGLVHLEANSFSLPSIGSSNSANDDVIKHRETGLLVKQKDSEDLYQAMKLLIIDSQLYSSLSKNAQKHAEEYTWEKFALKLKKELEEL